LYEMCDPHPRSLAVDESVQSSSNGSKPPTPRPARNTLTMIPISKVAAAVQPSATLAAGAKAKQLKAAGVNVFDFSLGEPDFPTPEHICAAAVRAMQAGHTRYTPASGIIELRKCIAKWYEKTYRIRYTPE